MYSYNYFANFTRVLQGSPTKTNPRLESLGVPTDPTAEGKLLPRRGVFHVQGALGPLQGFRTGSHGTLRQLRLGHAGEALEVIVAGVAKVGRPKAEVDGHRAAVATLVL